MRTDVLASSTRGDRTPQTQVPQHPQNNRNNGGGGNFTFCRELFGLACYTGLGATVNGATIRRVGTTGSATIQRRRMVDHVSATDDAVGSNLHEAECRRAFD